MTKPESSRLRKRACPICSRPSPDASSRFCSERCAQVDLGRWLRGDYAIPVRDEPPLAPSR